MVLMKECVLSLKKNIKKSFLIDPLNIIFDNFCI